MILQNVLVRTLHSPLGVSQGIVDYSVPHPIPDCSNVRICKLGAPHAPQHDKEMCRMVSHGVNNFVRLKPLSHSSHLSVVDAEK